MFQRLIAVLLIVKIFSHEVVHGQEKNWTNMDSCFSNLEAYSHYWKIDSLGKNGFRQLMADRILTKCYFQGEKWKNVYKYFGNPNFKYNSDGNKTYRYRLNYQSKDITMVGTMLLDIEVDKTGVIVRFSIFFIDG